MAGDMNGINDLLRDMTPSEQQLVELFCVSLVKYRDDKLAMIPVLMIFATFPSSKVN